MNEDSMMRKAERPILKNRRTRSRPARIRHLQKQQKLWMASKIKWRKPGKNPGLAPFSYLRGSVAVSGVRGTVTIR